MTKVVTTWYSNDAYNATLMPYSSSTEYSNSSNYSSIAPTESPISTKEAIVWS